MNIHPVRGPVESVADLASADDRVREILFLDLLERGYYPARRGFIALTVAVSDEDLDGFVAAMEDVIDVRKSIFPACD